MKTITVKMLTNFKTDRYGLLEYGRTYELFEVDAIGLLKNKRAIDNFSEIPAFSALELMRKGKEGYISLLKKQKRIKERILDHAINKTDRNRMPELNEGIKQFHNTFSQALEDLNKKFEELEEKKSEIDQKEYIKSQDEKYWPKIKEITPQSVGGMAKKHFALPHWKIRKKEERLAREAREAMEVKENKEIIV